MRKMLPALLVLSVVAFAACSTSDSDDGAGGSGAGGSGAGGSGAGGSGAGGTGGSGGGSAGAAWTLDGVAQAASYTCTTTLPGGVFGVTASGGDWTLELSMDESHSSAYTLPQTSQPTVQVRATRVADGAIYDSSPTGSLAIELDPSSGALMLNWIVAANLVHTSGGAGDPAAVDVAGSFLCTP